MSAGTFTPDPSWPSIVELAKERWGEPTQSRHDDIRFGAKGSKSVKPSANIWHDHETDERGGYVEMHRATRGELPKRKHGNGKLPPWQDISTIYDYRDADGTLILQKIRTLSGNPRFCQRRPDGKGKWIWNTKDIPAADRPLYRLPGLRASGDATVWICEGEKDADNLHDEGLIATTSAGGAGKWQAAYATEFRGKPCVVLQDNDQAGRDHVATVAQSLTGVASSVKVLLLPNLPPKGDVSDWLDAGGTLAELERLAREAPEYSKQESEVEHPALRLRYGFAATHAEPLGTIVEGLLHAGSLTLVYGPPKSGKSFLVTDLTLAIAAGRRDWMGHNITRPGPVLYVACEGHAGFWKRLAAAAKERGWDETTFPAGFILATGRPMLIRADARGMTYAPDPSSILAALDDAKQRGLDPVGIVIDTVFRSFGVGNVNASPDMNVYLACIAVLTDQGYAVTLVHHEIKSGGTPAGSVSLIGGADTIVHVWRDEDNNDTRFWQVEMAKDDAETSPRAFSLAVNPIGLDADGRPASSCVIRDDGAAPDASAKKKRGRPASENSDGAILATLIYDELCNLLSDPRGHQDYVSFHPEAQPIRAVSRVRLRGAINQTGILDPVTDEADRKRITAANDRDVKRAINRLKKQRKVAANEQWIGLPKPGGSINAN